ncbi:MAG TPA: hypothetical protein PLL06_03240 [Acidobacteriota bacterium]|nr:hypothetical protein [Acidobacteriota bacterium]HNG91377.1 hypothetical protein [Acidobacteriota bacterium]
MSSPKRQRKTKQERRKASKLRSLQSLLDDLAKDVPAFEEMDQYEEFLEGLAGLYDVENPEAIYEQWVRLPEHTTEQLAQMLSEAERNERKKNGTQDCSNHAPNP